MHTRRKSVGGGRQDGKCVGVWEGVGSEDRAQLGHECTLAVLPPASDLAPSHTAHEDTASKLNPNDRWT
jgi:hypothetical protein